MAVTETDTRSGSVHSPDLICSQGAGSLPGENGSAEGEVPDHGQERRGGDEGEQGEGERELAGAVLVYRR